MNLISVLNNCTFLINNIRFSNVSLSGVTFYFEDSKGLLSSFNLAFYSEFLFFNGFIETFNVLSLFMRNMTFQHIKFNNLIYAEFSRIIMNYVECKYSFKNFIPTNEQFKFYFSELVITKSKIENISEITTLLKFENSVFIASELILTKIYSNLLIFMNSQFHMFDSEIVNCVDTLFSFNNTKLIEINNTFFMGNLVSKMIPLIEIFDSVNLVLSYLNFQRNNISSSVFILIFFFLINL